MLMIVAIETQQFLVTAIFWVIGMVVINVVNGKFTQVGINKLAGTATADLRIDF